MATGLPEWAIRIQEQASSLGPLATKEETPEKYQRRRMYKLPASVHKEQDFLSVYKPARVSLGPLSVDFEHDSAKEVNEASLIHFLRRSGKPIDIYRKALTEVVEELRGFYDGLDRRWRDDTHAFVHMMLLDGCFLLEFIRTIIDHQKPSPLPRDASVNNRILRVVESHDDLKRYIHDVLLLENQLPMSVLLTLIRVNDQGDGGIQELRYMLLKIGMNTFGVRNTYVSRHDFKNSSHLMDVYRRSLVHYNFKSGKTLRRMTKWEEIHSINNIPSATQLDTVGIGFTTSNSTSLLDIRLRGKTLRLPKIDVDGLTKSTFLNFIAFEQLHKNVAKKEITSYMYFMGCLVQSAEDASLLQARGIIATALPAAEVASLFGRMSKDIRPDRNDPLIPEFIHILAFVRARYNQIESNAWQRDLNQRFLKTPWKIISVVVASIILILAITQTLYTVLGYVHRK